MNTASTCATCGSTLPEGVDACPECGAPVAHAPPGSGERTVWDTILEKLQAGLAPKYHVTRLLGYGGMAGVYLAEDQRLGRQVAIKVMAPGLMVDPKLVDRFQQEARTIAQLHHPNIITIYDVAEAADLHYFVMGFVPGRTVGHVLSAAVEPLPIPVVKAWLSQVGSALDYAHRSGIVHRDIKPGNILLDREGNAVVTDFGIAKVADEPGLTKTGMLVGTPAYMSPEQCSTGKVSGWSDQYSLGAVAYQMLTGGPPFEGQTLMVLQAHLSESPRPIVDKRPDCPPQLAATVHRMLAKNAEERWSTMAEALVAMDARPIAHADPVRLQLIELAAWVDGLTISSTRGINRPPVPSVDVATGERFQLTAVTRDTTGRVLHNRRVTWFSGRSDIATVTPDGAVQALRPGTAQIRAECEGVVDAVAFHVVPSTAPATMVVPERQAIPIGGSVDLSGLVTNVTPVPPPANETRDVTWTTSDPSIAVVTSDGKVRAVGPGSATIIAHAAGRTATAVIEVTPAPSELVSRPPVEVEPPREEAEREPLPADQVSAPSVPVDEVAMPPVPADGMTVAPVSADEVTAPPASADEVTAPPVPADEVTAPPISADEVTAPPVPADEVTAPTVAVDEGTAPRVPADGMTVPSVPADEVAGSPVPAVGLTAPGPTGEMTVPGLASEVTAAPVPAAPTEEPRLSDREAESLESVDSPAEEAGPAPDVAGPVTRLFAGDEDTGPSSDAPRSPAAAHAPTPSLAKAREGGAGTRLGWQKIGIGTVVLATVLGGAFVVMRGGSGAGGTSVPEVGSLTEAGVPEGSVVSGSEPGAEAVGGSPGTGDPSTPADAASAAASDSGGPTAAPGGAEIAREVVPEEPTSEPGAGAREEAPTTGAQPPARDGTIRIGGGLPQGSTVLVTGPSGTRRVQGAAITLPAGRYEVEVQAPGYEVARGQVDLEAGTTQTWNPSLAPVPETPPPADPAPTDPGEADRTPARESEEPPAREVDTAERAPTSAEVDAEQIAGVVRSLLAAFEQRTMNAVLQVFPDASSQFQDTWRPLVEDQRNVQDLQVRLVEIEAPGIDGDRATVGFTARVQFRDFRNQMQDPNLTTFQATLRRSGDRWALADLVTRQ